MCRSSSRSSSASSSRSRWGWSSRSRRCEPGREPRRRHARPRLHDPGGGVRQPDWIGEARRRHPHRPGEAVRDRGRRLQPPARWAVVCLVCFVLALLVVANLRRSRTGRRLIAVRTNERAAASLGISVFGVKLYAFAVASALAGLAWGILVGFKGQVITYTQYTPAVDQQPRVRGDRRPRLRARRGVRRAERDRRASARASSRTGSASAGGTSSSVA